MPFRWKAEARRAALLALLALSLSGCAAVAVVTGANAVHDRRTVGTVLDDESIEFRTYDAIHRDDGPGKGNHVRVVSYNRVVLLAGEVRSEADKTAIEEAASEVPDIRRIVNELAITDARGIGRRSRDTILTGQIKAALLGVDLPGFAPQRVKVVSIRGIAYLMGLLTEAEAELVAERVATVRGVRSVVKVFEYMVEQTDSPEPDTDS